MRTLSKFLLKTSATNYRYKSTLKILRKTNNGWRVIETKKSNVVPVENHMFHATLSEPTNSGTTTTNDEIQKTRETEPRSPEHRENEMKIQMLSKHLHEQIFGNSPIKTVHEHVAKKYHNVLKKHGITVGESSTLPDVDIKLPPLHGTNVIEHFHHIADEQLSPYKSLIESLLIAEIPKMPNKWKMTEGWTKYNHDGSAISVPYPDEKALTFDIENCMREGNAPTIACAVGPNHWYSWCSKSLIWKKTSRRNRDDCVIRIYRDDEMITMEPAESEEPRIIIGHHVSFDRARIRNQYDLKATATRFLDTMSMHTCVSGVTSYQRAMLKSSKPVEEDDNSWREISSLNGLVDCYNLYCSEDKETETISKELRSMFIEGTLPEIQRNFQDLMTYCANDVIATTKVFKKLYPMFKERFPHPATLAGMLELGMAYLPVNSNWVRYINECDLIYKDLDIESKYLLAKRANQACRLLHNDAYKRDLWLWDEDWSTQRLTLLKRAKSKSKRITIKETKESVGDEFNRLKNKFEYLFDIGEFLPKRPPLLPGYPTWYRKLCLKSSDANWQPGPNEIGTGMQIAPKLLYLCWEGYPLHYIREHGWGFLVPFNDRNTDQIYSSIPLKELIEKCPPVVAKKSATHNESAEAMRGLSKEVEMHLSKKDYYSKVKTDPTGGRYKGTGVWCNVELDESCWFFKLPHKNGLQHRVGNPLARDFLIKFSENVLAGDSITAERVIQIARMLSYWRNNRDRIKNQIVVTKSNENNSSNDSNNEPNRMNNDMAAILPQVVTCGTLTRRASEPTWMTASNAQTERIGSELRSMVQPPDGYRIVGADVDSQELWIASVLGDANATGIHGATPLGWMTLNGTKANATDMHSVTAKAVGISRDQAKVLNYARIYGAGQIFATRLLKQFNPTISDGEAKSKAMKMFLLTKGKKVFRPKPEFLDVVEDTGKSLFEAKYICAKYGKPISEVFLPGKWSGGTESAMFNRLEEIAESEKPVTPFLESRLSRALEPKTGGDDRYLPTRINWIVQSGAVDFLHLMMVCMRWLMKDKIRFCLSFHDEVRYIVKEEHAYKAALAMHLTNLLVRSFCSSRIGLNDLPQSIAFFASVEVDRALRKEAQMDCKTPSNPHGLAVGYGIPIGESLDIENAIKKANSCDLNEWPWHKKSTTNV